MTLPGPGPARPRLGFLGVGWIGRQRLAAIAQAGVAQVAAVADPSAEAAQAAAAAAPGCAVLPSLDALLDLPLDGVVIATPSALHAEQAVRALARGRAVFCQKPLARTAPEARRVVEAARAADRLLAVDLSYRHCAGVPELRELVRGGALGPVQAVELAFHNAYGPDKPWFRDLALAGGGCLVDLGTHLVDLARWVLGPPAPRVLAARLAAGGAPLRVRDRVEDQAVALLEVPDGPTVQLACSWWRPAGQDCVIEACFHGTEGGVALRNVAGSFVDLVVERHRGTSRERLAGPPDAWGGRAATAFAARLAVDRRFDPAVEEVVDVAETIDAVYRAAEGRP